MRKISLFFFSFFGRHFKQLKIHETTKMQVSFESLYSKIFHIYKTGEISCNNNNMTNDQIIITPPPPYTNPCVSACHHMSADERWKATLYSHCDQTLRPQRLQIFGAFWPNIQIPHNATRHWYHLLSDQTRTARFARSPTADSLNRHMCLLPRCDQLQ